MARTGVRLWLRTPQAGGFEPVPLQKLLAERDVLFDITFDTLTGLLDTLRGESVGLPPVSLAHPYLGAPNPEHLGQVLLRSRYSTLLLEVQVGIADHDRG